MAFRIGKSELRSSLAQHFNSRAPIGALEDGGEEEEEEKFIQGNSFLGEMEAGNRTEWMR